MANDERLIDILSRELSKLEDDEQVNAFRLGLQAELPKVIRKVGRAAKKAIKETDDRE